MQAGQSMRKPGDGVRFTRTRRVLNQIVTARTMGLRVGDQGTHRVQLMIAREDHRLPAYRAHALIGLDLLLLHLQVHEALQDLQQAIGLQHLIPEVMSLPVTLHRSITGPMLIPPVEGQETGLLPMKMSCHPHLIRVHGEVDQRTLFEGKEQISPIPVYLVLMHCIRYTLTGERILELGGNYRDTVNGQRHIDNATTVATPGLLQHRGKGDLTDDG